MTELTKEIIEALEKPFDASKVNLKVQTKPNENGNALIVPYMDARDVIERLNSVVAGDWSDTYATINGGLECALTICGVTRRDVGSNDNDNEPVKSAYSDALKRAAVKFGVGLYLYGLPKVWGKVKTVGKNFYIFDRNEENSVRAKLFGTAPNTEPAVHAEGKTEQKTTQKTEPQVETVTDWSKRTALIDRVKALPYFQNDPKRVLNGIRHLQELKVLKGDPGDDKVFELISRASSKWAEKKGESK